MNAEEIMTKGICCIDADATVTEACRQMRDDDVGCLAIDRNGKIVGVLTDRDIVIRCLAEGRDCTQCKVSDIMTRKVVFCECADRLEDVAKTMEAKKIRRILVKDDSGQPCGVISTGDLAARGHLVNLSGEVLEEVCQGV